MYSILLERGAERDLRRLSAGLHERVIAAIRLRQAATDVQAAAPLHSPAARRRPR